MIDQALLLVVGLAAGMGGGLLGIGGGIVLMPVLRFVIGLSPAYAAGTCILQCSLRHWAAGLDTTGWVMCLSVPFCR